MTINPLHVHASIHASSISFEVEVNNVWGEPVYLMTWLYDWYGMLGLADDDEPSMNLAFTFWSDDHTALVVQGESAPPADGISLFAPRRPMGYRLAKKKAFRNTVTLKLPLLEWYAYNPPTPDNTVPIQIKSVRYRVEVLRASEASYQREHPSFRGVWQVGGNEFAVECLIDLMKPVTLLKRLDADFLRLR